MNDSATSVALPPATVRNILLSLMEVSERQNQGCSDADDQARTLVQRHARTLLDMQTVFQMPQYQRLSREDCATQADRLIRVIRIMLKAPAVPEAVAEQGITFLDAWRTFNLNGSPGGFSYLV